MVEVEKDLKTLKKRQRGAGRGEFSRETVEVVYVIEKQPKKGKGHQTQGLTKTKRGGRKWAQCHNCGGDDFLRDYKEWKEIKEKLCSSSRN